ncbi:hypothetical protein M422DRAFT_42234 [Sphaerobolus stellatus SS14]|nr:hypothetical protein M422DRAFT_42234 [Sphaerobolus stellatus SS14]
MTLVTVAAPTLSLGESDRLTSGQKGGLPLFDSGITSAEPVLVRLKEVHRRDIPVASNSNPGTATNNLSDGFVTTSSKKTQLEEIASHMGDVHRGDVGHSDRTAHGPIPRSHNGEDILPGISISNLNINWH